MIDGSTILKILNDLVIDDELHYNNSKTEFDNLRVEIYDYLTLDFNRSELNKLIDKFEEIQK